MTPILISARARQRAWRKSLRFYHSVLDNPRATVAEKLFAQRRIDALHGVDAPPFLKPTPASAAPPRTQRELERRCTLAMLSVMDYWVLELQMTRPDLQSVCPLLRRLRHAIPRLRRRADGGERVHDEVEAWFDELTQRLRDLVAQRRGAR